MLFKRLNLDCFLQLSLCIIIYVYDNKYCILHEISYTRSLSIDCGNFLYSVFLLTAISPGDIAPRLSPSNIVLIYDIIESESFTTSEIPEEAEYSKQTIISIRNNLRQLGSITHDKPELIGNEITPPDD